MDEDKITQIIAYNICAYRKKLGLTQMELANKINYSDKSISKWEKAEGVPDIFVLSKLAGLFGITVNDLLTDHSHIKKIVPTGTTLKHLIVVLLSIGLVWFVASIAFMILSWLKIDFKNWLCFIYAILITFIVGVVFACIWGNRWTAMIATSGILWSFILCFTLTFSFDKIFNAYWIGFPFQIMIILWFVFIIKDKKRNL